MAKRGRDGVEFEQSVKDKALNKAGLRKGHVHHLIPAAEARRLQIQEDLVKSPLNAVALTPEDHRKLHRGWAPIPLELLKFFQKLQPTLFSIDRFLAHFPKRRAWKRRERKASAPKPKLQLDMFDQLESDTNQRTDNKKGRGRRSKK